MKKSDRRYLLPFIHKIVTLVPKKPKLQKPVFKVPEAPSSLDARIEQMRKDWQMQKIAENWKKRGDNYF